MVLAPEALAALVDLAASLFIYLAWAVCLGLLWAWRKTLAVLIVDIANSLNFDVAPFGVHLFNINAGDFLLSVNTDVQNALSGYAQGCDRAIGYLFSGLAWIFQELAHSSEWVARELLHTTTWLLESYLLSWGRMLVAPFVDALSVVRWAVHHFGAAEAYVKSLAEDVFHRLVHGLGLLRGEVQQLERWLLGIDRRFDRLEHKIQHELAGNAVIPAVGEIPVPIGRTIADLKRLARKHEGLFAASVMAGVMANVFGLPDWRCLTRGPLGRFARAWCGLDSTLLNLLLLGTAEAFLVTDLCDFAHLLIEAAEEVKPVLSEFVSVEDALIGCNGATAPPTLTLAPLHLPTSQTPLALAA